MSMSESRADVALLVDFTDLRHRLCPDATDGEEPGELEGPAATDVARHLVRFASHVGRLALARAYADWSRCAELCREISTYQLEPVLVPGTGDGEDRSHIRLVVDALEALYTGDEPDAYVLVTGDATLLPLVQKLRADGSEVIVVGPSHAVPEELKRSADHYYALEDVLDGQEPEPVQPRTWRGARAAPPEVETRVRGNGPESRRDRPAAAPARPDRVFDEYDWGPFVRLIDELEHRLPFVGVRYLVNKVLGLHNCGIDDARRKRELINRAVDDELIEMYPVGNVGDRADPVTACRLNRASIRVVAVLGETTTPEAPAVHDTDAPGDGEGAGDLDADLDADGDA